MKVEHNTQGLAIDPNHIAGIRANFSSEEKLEAAAEQFEAIFLQLVLKNMHSATEAIASDNGMFQSSQQQMIREMHDAQLSQSIAQLKQLGFSEQIVQQLSAGLGEVENKFKLLADAAALPDLEERHSSSGLNQSPAFSSPLWNIPNR